MFAFVWEIIFDQFPFYLDFNTRYGHPKKMKKTLSSSPTNILYRLSNWWKMINYMVCSNNSMSSPEDANYNCRECNSKFNSLEEMDEHMKKVHNLKISNE